MAKKISSGSAKGVESTSVPGVIQNSNIASSSQSNVKRSYLPQADVPSTSIEDALRVPRAIGDNYAFHPTQPLDVAAALKMQPTSGSFRMLTGASIAYGLTDGGYNATAISVTELAHKILEPQEKGEDFQARRLAFLRPRIIREFLTKYDRHKFPQEEIAKKVLFSMGVPNDSLDRTFKLIMEGSKLVGFLKDINGTIWVHLQSTTPPRESQISVADVEAQDPDADELPFEEPDFSQEPRIAQRMIVQTQRVDNRRVFITHGRNKSFVEPLKELLAFGELDPIVSVERESVSQPVPDKVMNDMRSCSSAIIHIEDERKLIDHEGNQQTILNANVLIEIGAAMALYGRKFILLVKSGVELPSNLQGLYQVRYEGDKLDGEATIRLLKAIKDMKNQPSPTANAS